MPVVAPPSGRVCFWLCRPAAVLFAVLLLCCRARGLQPDRSGSLLTYRLAGRVQIPGRYQQIINTWRERNGMGKSVAPELDAKFH